MGRFDTLRELLKTEYGISSMAELNAAIKKLDPIQIGIFAERGKEENANGHLKYGLQKSA